MPLSLIAGPANAGKVELLLDRYLVALEREPVLIVPNRSDVDRVERELLARRPALLGGSIGTFDDLFERIAFAGGDARPLVSQAQRALLVRRALAGARLNGLSASARFGGFADALLQTVGELESGLLDPEKPRRRSGRAARRVPGGARPARPLGPRPAAPPRRRAAPVRPRCVARRAGLRLRLRGSDRRRVGAARGARGPHRGERVAAVRARPARVRVAPPHRRGSRPSRRRPHRGAAAALRRDGARCDRAPRACAVQRRAAAAGAAATAPSASSRAPAHAARSSSSARSCSRCCAREPRRSRIGIVCPSIERCARAARDGTRHARRPVLDRRRGAARADAVRSCAHRAAPLRVARRDAQRPVHVPPLAVLRAGAARGRLRRGPAARSRGADAGARRRGVGEAARCAAARARGAAATPTTRSRRCARSRRGCCVARTDSTVPPRRRSSRLDLRAHETVTRLLGELERWRGLVGELSREDVDGRARAADAPAHARRRAGPGRRRRPAARAHAPLRRRLHARTRGGKPAATRLVVAVPRRRRTPRARRGRRAPAAARPGQPRPLPLLHGVHAGRCSGSTSSARRPPTTAARASRARSGTRCRPCSTRRTCGAGRAGVRSRR